MKKFLGNLLLIIYAIVAIVVTLLLLSYNEYKVSELGGYTFYIIKDESFEPTFKKGDLAVIKKSIDKTTNVGDEVFVYKNITSTDFEVEFSKLVQKNVQGTHTFYALENGNQYDSSYVIGKASETKVFHNLGTVLSILESRWGYLFLVVVVSLLLLLQQIFELIMEIKYGNEMTKEEIKNQ